MQIDGALQKRLDAVLAEAAHAFGGEGYAPDKVAVTWFVRPGPAVGAAAPDARAARHRGGVPFYPASVVKLFFQVALQAWYEAGRLSPTPELDRACRDMIVDSGNDATHLIVDALTGTTGGLELPDAEMTAWQEARHAINRYFGTYGWPEFDAINVCQKTYAESPYGREWISRRGGENSNRLTTDSAARLLDAVMTGGVVTAARCAAMRDLLERDPAHRSVEPSDQIVGYIGEAVQAGSRLWSKAGWVSWVRHDCAHVQLPDGTSHTLAVFTGGDDLAANARLIPWIAARLLTP